LNSEVDVSKMNKPTVFVVVFACLAVSYLAGQKSSGMTTEYEHVDVIDMVNSCTGDQFIGGCKLCDSCAIDEYKAGGCSYFKNTLCTLCSDIRFCQHENIRCTTRDDEQCVQCDETYWDVDCKPCTVCDDTPGLYETQACSQEADATCASCTVCEAAQFTTKVCDATSNSECTACADCALDTWMSTTCQTKEVMQLSEVDSVYSLGEDTKCSGCQSCTPRNDQFTASPMYATERCKTHPFDSQTVCTDCSTCPEGSFISQLCDMGATQELGTDNLCQDCTQRKEDEWTVFPCSNVHIHDAIHQKCSSCTVGEYKFADCTPSSDTVCPLCPDPITMLYALYDNFKTGLQYCKKNEDTGMFELRCDAEEDENGVVAAMTSKCGSWTAKKSKKRCTHGFMGDANCGKWESNCLDGFSGESCCYHKSSYSCGSLTSRERIGIRTGYQGEDTNDFVNFCSVLCDEFPDCMAFEVKDGGSVTDPEGEDMLTGDSICYFKAAYTQDPKHNWYGKDPSFNCYSNTCRQNSYELTGTKTINYDPNAKTASDFGITDDLIALEGDGGRDAVDVQVQGGQGAGRR